VVVHIDRQLGVGTEPGTPERPGAGPDDEEVQAVELVVDDVRRPIEMRLIGLGVGKRRGLRTLGPEGTRRADS